MTSMAVLGDEVYIATKYAHNRGCIHVISLEGEHRRKVQLDGWRVLGQLTAEHGQLYAMQAVELAVDPVRFSYRVAVLSPQLELVHAFEVPGVADEHCSVAARGDNELIVTDYTAGKIHVLACGAA